MNESQLPGESDGAVFAVDDAFLKRAICYQDRTLPPEEHEAFERELLADGEKLQAFARLQLQSALVWEVLRREAYDGDLLRAASRRGTRLRRIITLAWLAAALTVLASVALWQKRGGNVPIGPGSVVDQIPGNPPASQELNVRLSGASRARFVGQLVPPLQSVLGKQKEYALTQGLVELSFPTGAKAIVEAPAVFRVLGNDWLAIDVGRCSVHAPQGAEGFRLETPASRVVDRGTRFAVDVGDVSESEVQVIEGAADLYRKPNALLDASSPLEPAGELPLQARLKAREAVRVTGEERAEGAPIPFSPDSYRSHLPDRVVSYETSITKSGKAEELRSVTVQRGQSTSTYSLDQLIPVEVTWFKASERTSGEGGKSFLIGDTTLPSRRRDLLSDAKLNTGVVNAGGQPVPLQADPVMQIPEDPDNPNTPGFAVSFRRPVVNAPGPDVVFFEVQPLLGPSEGDAFHVSPLKFSEGRRSLTVRAFNLTLESPESRTVEHFYLYRFPKTVVSLEELESIDCKHGNAHERFRCLAVAIDLSDLGFADREPVGGLFFQDAADDDRNVVDPVFIAGLPE
jgi:hypothetical protein